MCNWPGHTGARPGTTWHDLARVRAGGGSCEFAVRHARRARRCSIRASWHDLAQRGTTWHGPRHEVGPATGPARPCRIHVRGSGHTAAPGRACDEVAQEGRTRWPGRARGPTWATNGRAVRVRPGPATRAPAPRQRCPIDAGPQLTADDGAPRGDCRPAGRPLRIPNGEGRGEPCRLVVPRGRPPTRSCGLREPSPDSASWPRLGSSGGVCHRSRGVVEGVGHFVWFRCSDRTRMRDRRCDSMTRTATVRTAPWVWCRLLSGACYVRTRIELATSLNPCDAGMFG